MESAAVILARHGLSAKKSWGQNFLSDEQVLARIAEACRLSPADVVVELGAGLGHLTRALAATGARVVAVERDRDLVELLGQELTLPNVTVVAADAARVDFAEVAGAARPVVAGNLPYQLSGRILHAVYAQHRNVARAVFTLQREVAVRIASSPGGRDYGLLSVLLQAAGKVERLFDLPAGAFHPAPKVGSAVVRITLREGPSELEVDRLDRVVKAAFGSRRKTLANALHGASLGSREAVAAALAAAGVDGARRAETLAPAEFVALTKGLAR